MDKPLFDSDVDPKRIKNVADGLRRQGEFESARMLDGYADMLEAQEKAVPVASISIHGTPDGHTIPNVSMNQRLPVGYYEVFLRSGPADTERLAEALRKIAREPIRPWPDPFAHSHEAFARAVHASWCDMNRTARQALAAHSAQAQPPTTRVTDAMVKAAMRADFCGHNVADALMCGTDWNTEVMRAALEAALAAQENPNG